MFGIAIKPPAKQIAGRPLMRGQWISIDSSMTLTMCAVVKVVTRGAGGGRGGDVLPPTTGGHTSRGERGGPGVLFDHGDYYISSAVVTIFLGGQSAANVQAAPTAAAQAANGLSGGTAQINIRGVKRASVGGDAGRGAFFDYWYSRGTNYDYLYVAVTSNPAGGDSGSGAGWVKTSGGFNSASRSGSVQLKVLD